MLGFGKFGSALIISLHEDGGIFGCQVVHTAHQKQGFSSIGKIKTNNFEYADGKVQGELTTDGPDEMFGETWEVNVKFVAPLGEIPKEFQLADSKKPEQDATDKPDNNQANDRAQAKRPRPSRRRINSTLRIWRLRKMRPTSITRRLLSNFPSRARRT